MHGRMYGYAPHPADMHGMAAGVQPGLDMAPGQVRACHWCWHSCSLQARRLWLHYGVDTVVPHCENQALDALNH